MKLPLKMEHPIRCILLKNDTLREVTGTVQPPGSNIFQIVMLYLLPNQHIYLYEKNFLKGVTQ